MLFPWLARNTHGAVLKYPLHPAPHTAVFDSRFRAKHPVRVLQPHELGLLTSLRIEAVAANVGTLNRIAGSAWRPAFPVLVFSSADNLLADEQRSFFWEIFRVPIFEQVLDGDGDLLAWECEAHYGMHVADRGYRSEGSLVVHEPCECGRSGPRLVPHASSIPVMATA